MKVDGVVSADISMPNKAAVKVDPKVQADQLISAIKSAGPMYSAAVAN